MNFAKNQGIIKKEVLDEELNDESSLSVFNIHDNSFIGKMHQPSWIGDFSANPFVCDGENILEIKPSAKTEPNNVYMKSILDLIQSMNIKITSAMELKSKDSYILDRVYNQLLINDHTSAFELLASRYSIDKTPTIDLVLAIKAFWKKEYFELKEKILSFKSCLIDFKKIHEALIDKLLKETDECQKLGKLINLHSREHKTQIESLLSEKNVLKDGILKILYEFKEGEQLKSKLDFDLLEELSKVVEEQINLVKIYKSEIIEKDNKIEEMENLVKNENIKESSMKIQEQKNIIKKLQEENINFSSVIQKLSEKNIKIKQENVLLSNELKKYMELVKMRNETIQRQKSLINMFQDRLTGYDQFPINHLKKKKEELEFKIQNERDVLKKDALRKAKNDCEKRLSDFIDLFHRT